MTTKAVINKMDKLINKIYRFLPINSKKDIKYIIQGNLTLNNKLLEISDIVTKFCIRYNIKPDPDRQDYIIQNLKHYLDMYYPYLMQDNCRIIDIGGGNGNVISGLRNKITSNTNTSDFICYETELDWAENYAFNNQNILYKYWNKDDTKYNLEQPDNSVDIILCMVSLHHMTNDTIATMLTNFNKVLKPNGKVFIKEHDRTINSNSYIFWEHHLYHILDCAYNCHTIDIDKYFNTNINNFKSKEQWNNAFTSFGFETVNITNRFLNGEYSSDETNISELYWAIYQKKT